MIFIIEVVREATDKSDVVAAGGENFTLPVVLVPARNLECFDCVSRQTIKIGQRGLNLILLFLRAFKEFDRSLT
jgi:hypothetical protein